MTERSPVAPPPAPLRRRVLASVAAAAVALLAIELAVDRWFPVLGQVPIDPGVRTGGDEGEPR